MGQVYQNETIDDTYSAEVIAKARSLSAEIEEYVVTQRYLTEVEDADVVDPEWLRNRLTVMVVEELERRGINIQLGKPQICLDPSLVHLVMVLRSKFDTDKLFDFLRDREELREEIGEISADESDCIEEVVLACNRACPLDEGWEYIGRMMEMRPEVVSSSEEFVELLSTTIERADRMGPPDPMEGDNHDKMAKFVGYLGDRKRKVAEIAATIYSTVIKSAPATESIAEVSHYRKNVVTNVMDDFEKELGRSKYVVACCESADPAKELNNIRNKFTVNWRHCLDYWCRPEVNSTDSPSELDIAIMTATLFVDAGVNNSAAKALVIDAVEQKVDALGKNYQYIRDGVDNALANIVLNQEGGLNNAAQ